MPNQLFNLLQIQFFKIFPFRKDQQTIRSLCRLVGVPAKHDTFQCFPGIMHRLRVIHPDLPIRPGTVRVKTSLKSDIGLTFLANSITLTPGTTTVDIDKERGLIYVHRINIKEGHAVSEHLPVVEKFENILRKVFE